MPKTHKKTTQGELPSYKSLRAAFESLKIAGYKIGKSKIYEDRDKGLINVLADGRVLETEVRAYAATLQRKDANIDDLSDVNRRRAQRDVELREIKIKRQNFEYEKEMKKWVPRKDFEAELAARAAVFDSGLRHLFNTEVQEWIALVGGKPEKAPDFLTALNQALNQQLTQYATTKNFHVMFINKTKED